MYTQEEWDDLIDKHLSAMKTADEQIAKLKAVIADLELKQEKTRHFSVSITDSDGECHQYIEHGDTLWDVAVLISDRMRVDNYYGHKREDTIDLTIGELA